MIGTYAALVSFGFAGALAATWLAEVQEPPIPWDVIGPGGATAVVIGVGFYLLRRESQLQAANKEERAEERRAHRVELAEERKANTAERAEDRALFTAAINEVREALQDLTNVVRGRNPPGSV
jgi:hypothetical protein